MSELPKNTILTLSADRKIALFNLKGEKVGVISFSGDTITFSGNINEAVNTLFSTLKWVYDPFMKR